MTPLLVLCASAFALLVATPGDATLGAATTTTLSVVANPDIGAQPVTFTATVSASTGNPTGTIDFDNGSTEIAAVPVSPVAGSSTESSATYGTTLAVGTYSLQAFFVSTSTSVFQNSHSSVVAETVESIPISPTQVALTANPSTNVTPGESVTLTAVVSETGGGTATPTGTVTFYDNTLPLTNGTVTLDSTGTATYSVGGFSAGTNSIEAVYSGDANNSGSQASTSIGVTAPPTVYGTQTTLSSTAGTSPLTPGQSVTFTAQVVETGAGTAIPTGIVTFTDNGVVMGGSSLDANGSASISDGGFVDGPNVIVAEYGGDATDDPSSSNQVDLTVTPPTPSLTTTTTVALSPSTIESDNSVAITATVVQNESVSPPAAAEVTFEANGIGIGSAPLGANGTASITVGGWIPGTYNITASYVGNTTVGDDPSTGQATLNVLPAGTPTLTVSAPINATMQYGSAVPSTALVPSYSGFVTGDSSASLTTEATCTTTATSSSPVGSYPIVCSGATDSNYLIGYVDGSITVTAAPLSVSLAVTMPYGSSALPTLTPSYTGFVNGDTASSLTAAATCTTAATAASPVGNYPVTCSGATDTNYAISYSTGSLTVIPAVLTVVAPTSPTKVYGAALPSLTATYSGFVNGDMSSSLTAPATCTTSATAASPVGSYTVTCSGATDPNYTIIPATATLKITAASLTITAPSLSLSLGGILGVLTPTYSGFVNGDTLSSLTTAPTCTTTAGSSSPVGSYPITCTGAVDANYAITYIAGTLTIFSPTPTCISGVVYGYTVRSGQSVCFGPNAAILGPLTVNPGGAVAINGSIILGPVQITGATSVEICGVALFGPLSISDSTGAVDVGNGGSCGGSIIVGPVSITGNTAGISLVGDGITGPVTITGNASGVAVENDTIVGPITVTGNTGTITVSGNNVAGPSNIQSPAPTPLTVSAPSTTVTAGSALPTLTPTYSGFLHGNTIASLTKQATCTTTATSSSKPGSYPITCSGAVDPSYAFSYVAGTLTIVAAPPSPHGH